MTTPYTFSHNIMRIHQNLCSSLSPSWKKTEAGGFAQISDCYVHICYCFCIAGHSLGALVYLKQRQWLIVRDSL